MRHSTPVLSCIMAENNKISNPKKPPSLSMMKNDMYFPVSFINEIKHSLSKNKKKKKHKDSGMTNYPKVKNDTSL